jgi:hypothetical protein
MIPAKRTPAAIPAITGLFIVAIENSIGVKKHCFVVYFLINTEYEHFFVNSDYIYQISDNILLMYK